VYGPAAGWMMVPSVIKSDPGNEGTLCVIFHTELGVDVVLGRPRPGERRKNDAMREGQSTDLERYVKRAEDSVEEDIFL
jgi:hypothetical protein